MGEIEETSTANNSGDSSPANNSGNSSPTAPDPKSSSRHKRSRSVRTKVPEVELRLYRRGEGPIDVVRATLGGWDQNQLGISDILDKYGFKSVYDFDPDSGRGRQIRYARNGRSIPTYVDGSIVLIDGEPKDSLGQLVTKVMIGVLVLAVLMLLTMKDTPEWAKKLGFTGGRFPPWIIACVVVVFTRMRRTRNRNFFDKPR